LDNWQSVGNLPNFFSSLPSPADPAPAARRLCKQTASRPPPSATDKEAGGRLPKIQI